MLSGKVKPFTIYHAHLGLIDYDFATTIQEVLHDRVVANHNIGYLLTLEHPPTITMGKHAEPDDLKVPLNHLRRDGIKFATADRGGQLTGHNPGQLVVYPILSLKSCGLGVRNFVHAFERITLATLQDYEITAQCQAENPGAWVGDRKIASVGFRIEKKVSRHGLAINLNNHLDLFDLFIPCGLAGVSMTSLHQLRQKDVNIHDFIDKFLKHFSQIFSIKPTEQAAHELIALGK